jgi:hypothetical protein
MSAEYPPVLPSPEWSGRYLQALGYTGGQRDARRVAARLREIAGSRPVTVQDCYVVVSRAELQLLAQVVEHSTDVAYAPLAGCV